MRVALERRTDAPIRAASAAAGIVALALLGGAAGVAHAQAAGGNPLDSLPRAPEAPAPGPAPQVTPAGSAAVQQLLALPITPVRFDIGGVKSIPFATVQALFAPLTGQPTTVGRLIEQSQAVTRAYQGAGYALSFAYLPAQDFAGGVVRVVAVEGHVADVRIDGDAGKARQPLLDLAQRIRDDKPLRQQTFDRYVQLMSQLPGLRVEASAPLPASTDGATLLTLKATSTPYAVTVGAEGRGKHPRAVVTGTLNQWPFAASQLKASTILSTVGGESYAALQYSQFIGSDGLSVKLDGSRYRGDPDAQLAGSAATGGVQRRVASDRIELSASYPLQLSASQNLVVSGGGYAVDYIDGQRNPANGAFLDVDTKVRAVFGQLSYSLARPDGVRRMNIMLAHGIDGWGARAGASTNVAGLTPVNGAKLAFTRLALGASQSDLWPAKFGTAVAVTAQLSGDSLPPTERITFGGSRFARGYAPGESSGDAGVGVSAEINRAFAVSLPYVTQLQPYLLLEAASLRNEGPAPVPARLRSVAIGSRISDQRYYTLDLSAASARGDAPIENPTRKPRYSATLSYRLGEP
ncbi:MAG: ShlB/FhaC/HecB family hemolysin secretion/activation protein [Comamonadaceae bacterium]|nr:MAG: ShlB/FhaC/HecB family hemolysin secretion/activation protein [Comamonadaceae bacterium]